MTLGDPTHDRQLTGAEKVGVLLLALGPEKAAELLKKFDPEELNIVMRSADVMPVTSASQLMAIVEEFQGRVELGVPFVGQPEQVKMIVAQVISENRNAAESPVGTEGSQNFWSKLSEISDDVLLSYLLGLHPQIFAYILYRLGGDRAAGILKVSAADVRHDLVTRLLGMKEVTPLAVETLEGVLRVEFFATDDGASAQRTAMASILSSFDLAQTAAALDHIAAYKPKEAAAIKKMIFKFSDVDKLPVKALTAIMDGVPVERIVIALQGMPQAFIATMLATLSPRARRMAEAELKTSVNASAADLASSRRVIVEAVLKLVAQGTLDLSAIVAQPAEET